MKSLVRLLSILTALSLGTLAFASDKKAEECKDCKDASSCCSKKSSDCCKAEKSEDGAKKEAAKPEKK
jgi:hypothetical protein